MIKQTKQRKTRKTKDVKQGIIARRMKQPKPKKNPRPPRQNQTREITDVPLGTSQRNGFNKNLASKVVSKEEFIKDVIGTENFNVSTYSVNPGQASTFPWLALEAKQWEKYEFEYLEFFLKPQVTQYSTGANTGKVIMSFDSDASDAAPVSKREAEDVLPMADGMPYQVTNLKIPSFILKPNFNDAFYVRSGNLPGGADIKTYDIGNLFVSTIGQGQTLPYMSELWVRYRCRLMIPILEVVKAAPRNFTVSSFRSTDATLGASVSVDTYVLNWATTVVNSLGITVAGGVFTLPVGNYIVSGNSYYKANTLTSANGYVRTGITFLKNTIPLESNVNFETDTLQADTVAITPFYLTIEEGDIFKYQLNYTANATGNAYSDILFQSC